MGMEFSIITIYPSNLLLPSLLFCLSPLRTTSFLVNNKKNPAIPVFCDESRKTTEEKNSGPSGWPSRVEFNDGLDRRRCRGLFTSTARIDRARRTTQAEKRR
ncbi:hypothetical protein GGI43DRAFT_266884 [Trichoderma evansii]